MSEEGFREANRSLWDAWTEINSRSDFYDLDAFRAGATSLRPIELEELGDVRGKTLLHLQCHFGLDTLSWARLGARVTGVDFSPRAIRLAESLAEELDLRAHFVCSAVEDLPEKLDEPFDVVFTSYGVIEWLPDLGAWADVVARCLRPGGTFYMVEFHPAALTFSDDGVAFHHSYFSSSEPIRTVESGSYADPEADLTGTSYAWAHSLGDIVTALAAAGLRIEYLHEFPYSPYDCYPFTEEVEAGKSAIPGLEEKAPLTFSIRASASPGS
ncbi:MAG: class I SAM-dependent methyltransferase [bacterium]|nr:class I SAM-dependent methyltransferase [bacterium]